MITIDDFEPRSRDYGVSFGTPIARYYINAHLAEPLRGLSGLVMEFGGPTYARQTRCAYEILDIDKGNATADIHGDICDPALGEMFEGRYDAIICTAVLQLVANPHRAVSTMRRMLKPGGTLFLGEKSISPIDPWTSTFDRWRFTQHGLNLLMHGFRDLNVASYGNLYALCAYMAGIPAEELSAEKLDHVDPQYPVVTVAHGRK